RKGDIRVNYSFGFSLKGFIIFLLPMIPNLFYFLAPAASKFGGNVKNHFILDILEHGSQAVFFFMIIFLIRKQTLDFICSFSVGMVIALLVYYVLWILLFTGQSNLVILITMAILPVIYFILAEIWLNNYLAIIPTALFGIVHAFITYMDFS
ncbi:MAG: hypothetical protein K0R21_2028, partial [Anaerocolumna sp.]|nr:hypothetical protein [Anaerocolumna sp.]